MFRCPQCSIYLKRRKVVAGTYFSCPQCQRSVVPLPMIAKLPDGQPILKFLERVPKNPQLTKTLCPICLRRMELSLSGGGSLELDLCRVCKVAWFDAGELKTESPTSAPRIVSASGVSLDDIDANNIVHTLTSLPREENSAPVNRGIWATYVLLALMAVISLVGFLDSDFRQQYAFQSRFPFRAFGIPFISSIFLHGDLWHLVSNGYFLWMFGDNVEDAIGGVEFLELFFLSALFSNLAVCFLSPPHSYVGASGGLMGIIAFYVLSFKHARVSQHIFLFFKTLRITVPITYYAALYLVLEMFGAFVQMKGKPIAVSHLSHVSGALFGSLYWAIRRR